MAQHFSHQIPVALIDVGSGSVGVAHALAHKSAAINKPQIIAEQILETTLQDDVTIDRFVEETNALIKKGIEQIQKADAHLPEFILLTLSAPWVISQTHTIQYKKEVPFLCTQKLVDSLIEKEVEYMTTHNLEQFGEYGKTGVIIEKQLSHITLNGYSTMMPFGKRASTLELMLTVTISPKEIIERFTQTIRSFYGTRTLGFTSRMYSSYILLRDYYHLTHDAWIVDFGDEITDIGFIKDGFLLYHHTFPIGSNHLYRKIADVGTHTPHEAKAILEAYRLKKAGVQTEELMMKAISNFITEWTNELHKIFDTREFGFCAPESCFIIGDERFSQIIPEAIIKDPFIQHLCNSLVPRPLFLTSNELQTSLKQESLSGYHSPLVIDSLFAERIL